MGQHPKVVCTQGGTQGGSASLKGSNIRWEGALDGVVRVDQQTVSK